MRKRKFSYPEAKQTDLKIWNIAELLSVVYQFLDLIKEIQYGKLMYMDKEYFIKKLVYVGQILIHLTGIKDIYAMYIWLGIKDRLCAFRQGYWCKNNFDLCIISLSTHWFGIHFYISWGIIKVGNSIEVDHIWIS